MIRSHIRRRATSLILTILGGLLLAACGSSYACPVPDLSLIPTRETAKPVIFDGDMAQEDMNALLFLLRHPNVEVRAATVAATGETHCAAGVDHTLRLLEVAGAGDIPVACGPEEPLGLGHQFPAEWREQVDRAYGIDLPETNRQTASGDAAQVIVDTVNASPAPMTIVSVGPLTNIALALDLDPTLAGQIEMLYVMGGAVEVEGNVGTSGVGIENEVAEWNIYADPVAAAQVFDSGVSITLVPLDATQDAPVTHEYLDCLNANRSTSALNTVSDLMEASRELIDFGGFQFWDSLTAVIATDETVATIKTMTLSVVAEEGPQSGWTMPDPAGVPVRVATGADRTKFEAVFLTVLSK